MGQGEDQEREGPLNEKELVKKKKIPTIDLRRNMLDTELWC